MHRVVRIAVFVFALGMCPGGLALLEGGVCQVEAMAHRFVDAVEGDGWTDAYAQSHRDEHADACADEHGCSAMSHHCGCCVSVAVIPLPKWYAPAGPMMILPGRLAMTHRTGPGGIRVPLERPPAASFAV